MREADVAVCMKKMRASVSQRRQTQTLLLALSSHLMPESVYSYRMTRRGFGGGAES